MVDARLPAKYAPAGAGIVTSISLGVSRLGEPVGGTAPACSGHEVLSSTP